MLILLWDVDLTLVNTAGAGLRALERAFLDQVGMPHAMRGISPQGKTNPQIVREGLLNAFGRARDADFSRILGAYLPALAEELERGPAGHVMPGVRAMLEALAARPDVQQGLLTGNLAAGAKLKLGAFDLAHYFRFGAFGSDDENRLNLVPVALARLEVLLGAALPADRRAIIIGDTPRDVATAQHHGLESVAVSEKGQEALAAAGATIVLPDLVRGREAFWKFLFP